MIVGLSLGRPPKKEIRPRRATIRSACSCALPDAAAVIATSTPRPSVSSRIASTGSTSLPPIAASGDDDRRRHVEALAVQLDQEHPRRAARPGQPHVEAADGPGADDDDVVAGSDPGELLGVDRAGERLGDRRLGEPDPVGDQVEAVDRAAPRGAR